MQQVINLRRAQQRLRRDAAPVKTDAAQILGLNHGHLQLELRRPNGSHVTARAAADYDKIEFIRHDWLL